MSELIFEKHCARCKTMQPLNSFYGRPGKKQGYCKPCAKAYNQEHPTSSGETPEARERRRQRDKSHYQRNKEDRKIKARAYTAANRDRLRPKKRAYALAHRETLRATGRRWTERNREAVNARARDKWAARKQAAINAYGGHCYCCGIDDLEFLTIDHAHGNGGAERRRLGHKSRFYAWLQKHNYPQDLGLRVACWNCNCAARDTGICPHQMGVLKLVVNK